MKLSFSLSSSTKSSKPSKTTFCSSRDQDDKSSEKEFVTEFDPSITLADSISKRTIVIPPIPNKWNPQKQTTNIGLPVKSDDKFEVDPNLTDEPINSNISYGLNLRPKKDRPSDRYPEVDRSESSSSSINRLMLMKLRSDLKSLPEDNGLAEFDDVSVEEFAPTLLKGYGWYEGRGIGKNAKEDVKVFQFRKRSANEGFGFVRINGGIKNEGGLKVLIFEDSTFARKILMLIGYTVWNQFATGICTCGMNLPMATTRTPPPFSWQVPLATFMGMFLPMGKGERQQYHDT